MIEHLTKETFREKVFDFEKYSEWKYDEDLPCVIDFYADWCGPFKLVKISPGFKPASSDGLPSSTFVISTRSSGGKERNRGGVADPVRHILSLHTLEPLEKNLGKKI